MKDVKMIGPSQTMMEIYKLKNLVRYNNKFRIKDESVAEHTAIVALNVLILKQKYNFNLEKALTMALIHDIPEIYLTDVTHDVKQNFPDLAKILAESEKEVMKLHFPQYVDAFIEFEKGESLEAMIVLLADIDSVVLYSSTEIKLGNQGYMMEVLTTSSKLKEKILCKINNMVQLLS